MPGAVDDLRERAARAARFSERQEARAQLFRLGAGPDPWQAEVLEPELAAAAGSGAAAALAEVGRVLLVAGRLEVVAGWLSRLVPVTPADREACAIVRGLLAIREGANDVAVHDLANVPHPEAVALHGIALVQLGDLAQAAARLEVLLAADALNEQGEVPSTYLPAPTPALALFLTACVETARAHRRGGREAEARRHAQAGRDAVRRYPQAQVDDEVLEGLGELLEAG